MNLSCFLPSPALYVKEALLWALYSWTLQGQDICVSHALLQSYVAQGLFSEDMDERIESPSFHPNPTHRARTLPQQWQRILQPDWPHPNLLTRQRFHSGRGKLNNNQGLLCFFPHENPLVEQLHFSLHQNPLVEQGCHSKRRNMLSPPLAPVQWWHRSSQEKKQTTMTTLPEGTDWLFGIHTGELHVWGPYQIMEVLMESN